MSEIEVRIIELPPMTVASSLGFGSEPEMQALGALAAWIKQNGITDLENHRFIGFNNPDPSPGSPNYGYEQWMEVDAGVQGSDDVTIKPFSGGLFAVADCPGIPSPEKWAKLVHWAEDSPYRFAAGQCLEECLTPQPLLGLAEMPASLEDLQFLLYLPVVR